MMQERRLITSGAKTRKELAQEFNISRRTLYNWLKIAGISTKGKLLTPLELEKIYKTFGVPKTFHSLK